MIALRILFGKAQTKTGAHIGQSLQADAFFAARAFSSSDAVPAIVSTWRPDLILLDVTPATDVPAMLRHAQVNAVNFGIKAIPVVLVTAETVRSGALSYRSEGVIGMIAKPFESGTLADKVRRLVPITGLLRSAAGSFLDRLRADAECLMDDWESLSRGYCDAALMRVWTVAHSLAGAGGTFGYFGISCEAAALSVAVERCLVDASMLMEVEQAIERVLERIQPRCAKRMSAVSFTRPRRREPVQLVR